MNLCLHHPFPPLPQLLNAFGSGEWSTDNNQYVTLKPQEDMLVHVLYSPTTIATSQAKLSIKPQNSNFKYNVSYH